jgi:hypothetical protein
MRTLTEPGKLGKRLTVAQKQAVVSAVVSGRTQTSVAAEAGINPDTVRTLVRSSLGDDWKGNFNASLGPVSQVIVKAATDETDVHKAAISGFKLFAGLGLLQGEGNQVNLLIQLNNALPDDLKLDLVSTHDVVDITPSDGKQHNANALR